MLKKNKYILQILNITIFDMLVLMANVELRNKFLLIKSICVTLVSFDLYIDYSYIKIVIIPKMYINPFCY